MTTEHEKWLNSTFEEVIEPEIPIVDSHHHFFDRDHLFFKQLDGEYMLDELVKDIDGNNVVKTVFVDAHTGYRKNGPEEMQPVGETELVQNVIMESIQRGMPGIAAGIVSWADLSLGDRVAPVLEAHITAGKGRFRGIRSMATWDKNPEFTRVFKAPERLLFEPKYREGFAYLRKYNLSIDVMLFHPQLMDLVDLARTFSDTTIILNHTGAPLLDGPYAARREEMVEEWKRNMATLAACPNVFVKLGGVTSILRDFTWQQQEKPQSSAELAQVLSPFFLWCVQHFGVNRCMFESNFPVDRLAYSYNVLWNVFKRITAGFSSEEKSALFHDTAEKAYRLE